MHAARLRIKLHVECHCTRAYQMPNRMKYYGVFGSSLLTDYTNTQIYYNYNKVMNNTEARFRSILCADIVHISEATLKVINCYAKI